MKKLYVLFVTLVMVTQLMGQSTGFKAYLGIGEGFDYGGFGAKVELLPDPHIGIFGGVGYNILSVGWNAGVSYKILPDNTVSPYVVAMYGYNGVFRGSDSYTAQYNMTSYGPTVGVGLDVITGLKGNKLSVGLLVPFRTKKFIDDYHAAKDDPNVDLKNTLLPIGISFGYNFLL